VAGDILGFIVMQSTISGSRISPAMLAFAEGGGQDPENVAPDMGLGLTGGFENSGELLSWRQYDRVIRRFNDVTGIQFFAWIRDKILELSTGWALAHTITGQDPGVDFGLHTGLYHVTQGDGTEHLCGFYDVEFGGTGWLKFDPRTNIWTHAAVAGTADQAITFGMCVGYKGRLYHCNSGNGGVLQEFDPIAETLREFPMGSGAQYAKLAVVGGRLFIFPDSGQARLLEFAFGGVITAATLAAQSVGPNYSSGGDNMLVAHLTENNGLAVFWNCQQDGSGYRLHIVTQPTPGVPGSPLTVVEELGQIMDGSPDSLDAFAFFGNAVAYFSSFFPAIGFNADLMWTDGGWQLEQGPLFSGTPLAFLMIKFTQPSSYATANLVPGPHITGYPTNRVRVDWRGVDRVMTYVDAGKFSPPVDHSVSLTHSQITAPWGSSERLFSNGPSITNIKVEPYSDGTVARGLRLTFKIAASQTLGDQGSLLYFGFGRFLGQPNVRLSLSTGDNPATFPGGVATFDAASNRLENVPPTGVGRTTLAHDTPVGAFINGELVEGQTSLARGTIRILGSGAMFVAGIIGTFVDGEQLLGLTSAATANATAAPDPRPTYQIIWDVGASGDNIPEREWVSVQGAHFNTEGKAKYITSSNYQLQIITLLTLPGNPASTQGPVAEADPDTSATVLTTQGPVVEWTPDSAASPATTQGPVAETSPNSSASPLSTQGPVAEAATKTSETPATTQGPVSEFVPDADLEANLLTKVAGRPVAQGGGLVGFEDDSGPQGDRDALTMGSSLVLPGQPWEPDSMLPQGPEFAKRLDGKVELGRATFDAENDAVGTRQVLLDVDAAGLGALGVPPGDLPVGSILGAGLLLVVARATNVSTAPSTQPQLGLGVGGSFDDQVAQQALNLVATGQNEAMALVSVRDLLAAGDVLEAQLDVQAVTTGDYVIEIVVYGFHRVG